MWSPSPQYCYITVGWSWSHHLWDINSKTTILVITSPRSLPKPYHGVNSRFIGDRCGLGVVPQSAVLLDNGGLVTEPMSEAVISSLGEGSPVASSARSWDIWAWMALPSSLVYNGGEQIKLELDLRNQNMANIFDLYNTTVICVWRHAHLRNSFFCSAFQLLNANITRPMVSSIQNLKSVHTF